MRIGKRRGLPAWWLAARFAWDTSPAPLLATARRWILGELPRRACLIESSIGSARPLIAYAGLREGVTYVLPFLEERAYGGAARPSRVRSRVRWKALLSTAPQTGADLLALGCTTRRARRLTAPSSVLLPFRVHLIVPLTADPSMLRQRVSRKARQEFARQQRAREWELREASTRADFDEFYDAFHLPTMRLRHGEATRSVDRETAYHCMFRRGVLLFLTEGGERVAGLLCRWGPGPDTVTLRLAGVRGGDESHYRSGVYTGLYVMLQEWCAARGMARLDLSGCEPFLSKGILQFKRKLHPEVVRPANHFREKRLWLCARRDTAAVRDFLAANPVLAERAGGGFTALYFHDGQRAPRLDYRCEGIGVEGPELVDLDVFLAGLPKDHEVAAAVGGRACE